MISTIITIVESPFSERDYKRFGVEDLMRNGFKLMVWDISSVVRRGYVCSADKFESNLAIYRLFNSKNEVKLAISQLASDSLIINFVHYSYGNYFLYRSISEKKIPYCSVHMGAFPASQAVGFNSILLRLREFKLKRIINKIFSCIPYRYLGVNSASYALVGSEVSRKVVGMCDKATKFILAHSSDYDLYLKELAAEDNSSSENFIVFLDEAGPLHPEYKMLGLKPLVDPVTYYSELNDFLDYIEFETKMNVIIAAHPRSFYESDSDYFSGRSIVRWKTLELVKASKLVLTHASTSINFAVLYKKPIVFLSSSSYKNTLQKKIIAMLPLLLKSNAVVDLKNKSSYSNFKFYSVNEGAYQAYINNYTKLKGSPDLLLWDIFSNAIKAAVVSS